MDILLLIEKDIHIHICKYICRCVCMHKHVCAHSCICMCLCMCMCVYSLHSGKLNRNNCFYYFIVLSLIRTLIPTHVILDSLNSFQRTSQRSHFTSVCWSPISRNSYCAFQCLFTSNTIIPAILHKSPWTVIAEIISLSQQI